MTAGRINSAPGVKVGVAVGGGGVGVPVGKGVSVGGWPVPAAWTEGVTAGAQAVKNRQVMMKTASSR